MTMSDALNALPPEGELVSAPVLGVGEEEFDAVLGRWLAEDFCSGDYRHVYGWVEQGEAQS